MKNLTLVNIFRCFAATNLIILLLSCGSSEVEQLPTVANDSLPADIAAINQKINSDRNNPDLYFQRAKANLQHRNFETAISDMKIVLNIDSAKPDYYIFLSDLYFTQNKTRDTRDMLRKAIALDTGSAQALMKYSQLFYLLRKYDTATYYINRSLHFDNINAVAHFQKGMILKEWGDTAKAISSFQLAVEQDQNYFDSYIQLGVLLSLKKNPLALGYFDNALRVNAKSPEALYAKGKFLQDAGEYDGANKVYNSLLEISPGHVDATFNIAAVLFEQKKYDEAFKLFDGLIMRDENFYRGYYGRGRCYEAKGEKKKAIDDYKHCLALKPNYDLAVMQLDIIEKRVRKKIL